VGEEDREKDGGGGEKKTFKDLLGGGGNSFSKSRKTHTHAKKERSFTFANVEHEDSGKRLLLRDVKKGT